MALRYLMNIEGLPGRFNNLIFISRQQSKHKSESIWPIVCYFGGDIQNFHQEMIRSNNHEFLNYSLENVAQKLSKRFPQDDILVIQPSSIIHLFSRYENFVKSTDHLGTPCFDIEDSSCYEHFLRLLTNVEQDVFKEQDNSHSISGGSNLKDIEVKMIVFSKGQVVINQLARSLRLIEPNNQRLKLIELYFLDGGHNDLCDVWITDPKLIDSLINQAGCKRFHIGVTDFQLNKSQCIRDEERKFFHILSFKCDPNSIVRMHLSQKDYKHLTPIQLHFKLLDFLFEGKL